MIPAIVILHSQQFSLANRIKKILGDAEVHAFAPRCKEGDVFFDSVSDHLGKLFLAERPIIAIFASGIVIRALAGHLRSKETEPPVLSISQDGKWVVPLLGGHHGANDLSQRLGEALNGHAAITNASDTLWDMALDYPPRGLVWDDTGSMKGTIAALQDGKKVKVKQEGGPFFPDWFNHLPQGQDIEICVSTRKDAQADLLYRPKIIAIGIGCERNAKPEDIQALVEECLKEANIAPQSLAVIVSIDIKADEEGLHAVGREWGIPVRFFSGDRLKEETGRLANPSDTVFQEVGVYGVAEGAALAAVGKDGHLILTKRKAKGVTCALAQSNTILLPENIGKARGKISIVGIGPGQSSWRVPEADRALRSSTDWVGYHLYLDLLPDWGKQRHDFALGEEEKRVRHALDLTAEGKHVALISSGDAGIYAMASLVFELLETSEVWRRIEIEAVPGISAMQAAAARAGAPLGHDFCAISLSDLLTPWPVIENRLRAAGQGDFVISFYNPVSRKRNWQLQEAKKILLSRRAPTTPVLIAQNLGRVGESIAFTNLMDLDINKVDMLSLVIVGNSQSRIVRCADGKQYFFTPRGYAQKMKAEAS